MIGTSLKRYEIEEELGQGGMSVVYRGRDTALDREVAVKVLHEHLAKDEENRARFRREAQAIARLEHDHILDVYDFSGEEDDRSFIVMEYIPGMNLRDFVEEHGPPPPEVAAMIGTIVADALAHAHDHGVIHRDLKPENIMVSDAGTLTLMDFGIAHVADAETMTQTGNLLGSPAHMAPEIIDGHEVNRRSDIFSFGTVMYWLSTGEFPFQGDNAPHLLRQVLECNYEDPESVEPRMPRELSRIICRCLSRSPENRFASVADLRSALMESLDLLESIDISEDLDSYFNDPEGYTEEFESVIVDRLIERGRAAMEQGNVPEAISHFNRVLGYEPNNEEVQRELEELDREEIAPSHIALAASLVLAIAATVTYFVLQPSAPTEPVLGAKEVVAGGLERATEAHGSAATRRDSRRRAEHLRERTGLLAARHAGAALGELVGTRARAAAGAPEERTTVAGLPGERSPGEAADSVSQPSGAAASRSNSGRPAAAEDAGTASGPDAGAPPEPETGTSEQPETFTYKFKVLPLAATVYIDGRRMSAPEVLDGVALERGRHRLKVVSPGCKPYETTFQVDGPRSEAISVVLKWKPASIQVVSNRAAVVYVDGNKSRPYKVGANGANARIQIPFGKADSDRRETRKELTLEVRPRANLQEVRRQTVTLRPGESTSVNVNFPSDGK